MKKFFLVFNHILAPEQEKDARETLGVEEFVFLPENLKAIWSQIPADLVDLREILGPISEFVREKLAPGDFALVQGDYGASFYLVNLVRELGGIPVYATSRREVENEVVGIDPNGETVVKKVHRFRHQIFRPYFPEDLTHGST